MIEDKIPVNPSCPFCNCEMQPGTLIIKNDIGLLNSFGGYSVGSSSKIQFKTKKTKLQTLWKGKALETSAHFCPSCSRILFNEESKSK